MFSSVDFKKDIVIPAWEVIKSDLRIKRFYFIPWLVSITALTTILLYQSIYTYIVLFHKKEQAFELILKFFHSDYIVEIVVWVAIFLIVYVFILPIFEWGLIKYLEEKHNWNSVSSLDAIWFWLCRSLPLFEYNNMFSEFKYISVLNIYLFLIRFVWVEYIAYITYLVLILFFLSTFINIFFAYSRYEIVLKNKWVFASISTSVKISILNLKNTLKLYFFMILINIRVLINFLVFLFFPILMAIAVSYFTTKIFLTIAIVLLSILFIVFLFIIWYLTAVLDVFKTAVWYYAYINGRKVAEEEIEN